MKLFIVDAFTKESFGGNPAGVTIVDNFPSDETMIKIAAELKHSETAFIKILNEKEFNIRYFTPNSEVDLCGHATIASFKVLLEEGIIHDNDTYINHTLSGDLEIQVKNGYILMDMASPKKIDEISNLDKLNELYTIMGLDYSKQALSLNPMMISTGLPDIMLPVKDLNELNNIEPDFKKLTELSRSYNVVGVHAFSVKTDNGIHVRNFAPLYDIDEEAATGTSNGALTYYGYLNNFISLNSDTSFIQGEKMGRPSLIVSHIEKNENVKIKVGGDAVILVKGEINF